MKGSISVINEIYPANPNYKYKRPNRNIWIVENTVERPGLASLFLAQTWNAGVCANNFFNDNSLYYNKLARHTVSTRGTQLFYMMYQRLNYTKIG